MRAVSEQDGAGLSAHRLPAQAGVGLEEEEDLTVVIDGIDDSPGDSDRGPYRLRVRRLSGF